MSILVIVREETDFKTRLFAVILLVMAIDRSIDRARCEVELICPTSDWHLTMPPLIAIRSTFSQFSLLGQTGKHTTTNSNDACV